MKTGLYTVNIHGLDSSCSGCVPICMLEIITMEKCITFTSEKSKGSYL